MKIRKSYFILISFVISLGFLGNVNSYEAPEEILLSSEKLNAPVINMEIINKVNSLNTTWKAGVNKKFIGKSLKDAKKLLGLLPYPKDKVQNRLKFKSITARNDLPENFDLREQYPKCESIRDIRDQSTCSSCWAFSAAETMSDRICIMSNQKITNVRISAEDVLSCCGGRCGVGCRGGYTFEAWNYYEEEGTVTGGNYKETGTCRPYSFRPCDHGDNAGSYGPCDFDVETPECKKQCDPTYEKTYEEDKWYASDSYSLYGGEEQMMTEIYERGSIQVGYSVYEDFLAYTSGIYIQQTGSYIGGHAVKCIGWGVEDGVKYWLMANSWNTEWGENGFFKIVRGSNHCRIEASIDTGTPIVKDKLNESQVKRDFLKYLIE